MVLKLSTRVFLSLALASCFAHQLGAKTLDQILERAYNSNLDYLINFEQVQKAKEAENIAYSRLYPNLTLTADRREELDNNQDKENQDSTYSGRFVVSQTLYDPSVWGEWRRSELNLMSAELAYLRQKQQLTFDVKNAWFRLVTDIALAEEAAAALERLKQHRENAKHLYENGSIWRNDLLQADVRVARGEQSLIIAENTAKRSLTNLNILLHQNILTEITPDYELSIPEPGMELTQALTLAVEQRPDLQQQQIAVKVAKRDLDIAFAEYLPTVNAQITQSNSSNDFDFSDASKDTQLSINLRWTLWNNFANRSRNRSARHDVQIALKSYDRTKELVQQETHNAWLAKREAIHNIIVLEQSMAQAIENFRVTGIRYKEQLSTANDVLDAQDLLTSTRNDLLAAKGDYEIASAQLELAIGQTN